jgi:Tol biopolymer transport system component
LRRAINLKLETLIVKRIGDDSFFTAWRDPFFRENYGTHVTFAVSCRPVVLGNQLVFVSTRGGVGQLYAMNADGSGQVRLTGDSAGTSNPRVSPDGRFIAHKVGTLARVITAAGTTVYGGRNVGVSDFQDVGPWSPDGAYLSIATGLARLGSLGVLRTSDWSTVRSIGSSPLFCNPVPRSWSPDGGTLLYTVAGCATPRPVFALDVGSGTRTLVTEVGDAHGSPAWSPAGQRIALVRSAPSSADGADVYLINPDGTGAVNLTNRPASYSLLRWSPDGSRIAFVSTRGGTTDLWVMNADGSGLVNLTNDAAAEAAFVWAPGGDRIAFATNRDGNQEIYVVRTDGTGLANLTRSPGDDYSPQWSR